MAPTKTYPPAKPGAASRDVALERPTQCAGRLSTRESGIFGPSTIDLTKIKIPVLAINGQFDRPHAKTHRMKRELADFRAVVLPGKSHLTAIMAGYMPPEYIDELVKFIDGNDPQR